MYENGIETRSKIVAIARDLFWRNGYDSTGYRDISAAAESSPGLIHYHFKKKQLIGYAVYVGIISDIEDIVRELAPDADDLFQSVVISTIIWDLVGKSEEFSRFMYEVSVNRISVIDASDSDIYRYRTIVERFAAVMDEDEFRIRMNMAFAGECELFIDFASGEYHLGTRECAALDSRMSLQLMGVPADVIGDLIEKAYSFVDSHPLTVGERFVISRAD